MNHKSFSMKRLHWSIALLLLISCSGNSLIDQPFSSTNFVNEFNRLLTGKQLNREQAFLLQYALLRKNDRLDYALEDKTYRQIIEQAKTFEQDGLPVKEVFDRPELPTDLIEVTILNEGAGLIRKEKSTRLKKILKFNAVFTNQTEQEIALLNVTFAVFGPFKKHLTSAGFEVNCVVRKGESLPINFLIDGTNIKANLLHNNKYDTQSLMMDDLLSRIEIELHGLNLEKKTKYYEPCQIGNSARRSPFRSFDYAKDLQTTALKKDGEKIVEIHLGPAHFPVEESDEPIQIYR